jgi:hypothetical protein
MKKFLLTILLIFTISIYSQTTSTSSSKSTSDLFTTTKKDLTEEEMLRTRISSIISSTIGNKLRHPDPKVRKQALTYIVSLLGTSDLFNVSGTGQTTTQQTIGLVGVQFVSDLFLLLNDSDPEVSDLARVALDALFGTEDTFLKYMEDPDPIVKKYAIKIYTERCMTAKIGSDTTQRDRSYITQLSALRTLLVRLKYEKDEGIRKTLTDAIEQFLTAQKEVTGGKPRIAVDQTIINYLNDSNPSVRKNALKIIASMEYNPVIFNILLERLKIEKDEEVKSEIERTIEIIAGGTAR